MNKKIILAMVSLLIITAIMTTALTAIVITPERPVADFDATKLKTLKDYNGIEKIEVTATDFKCTDDTCYTHFYQKDLINSKVGFAKQKCITYENITKISEFDSELNTTNYYNKSNPYDICTDKTNLELTTEMDAWLKKRLEDYAVVQKKRATDGIIIKKSISITPKAVIESQPQTVTITPEPITLTEPEPEPEVDQAGINIACAIDDTHDFCEDYRLQKAINATCAHDDTFDFC